MKKKQRIKYWSLVIAAILISVTVIGCGFAEKKSESTSEPATKATEPQETAQPEATPEPVSYPKGSVVISEIMIKNHATLRTDNDTFFDWIEIYNTTGEDIDLSNWTISDKTKKDGMVFENTVLPSQEYLLVYASGSLDPEHYQAPFSLNEDETVFLKDPAGNTICKADCFKTNADVSIVRDEQDNSYHACQYPTPGYANTNEMYCEIQDNDERNTKIVINEIVVADPERKYGTDGEWIELKNISSSTIDLTGWYLGDSASNYKEARLSGIRMAPGGIVVLYTKDLKLHLNSTSEELYLVNANGSLADWVALKNIPYEGSMGRMNGQNGWFYFAEATPGFDNENGKRRVSTLPKETVACGAYDDVESLEIDFQADGVIHYSIGNELPTEDSPVWDGAQNITDFTTVRAFSVEDNALPSAVMTFNYILNQHHTLPIVCVTADRLYDFNVMYGSGIKNISEHGNVAFYENNQGFSVPCEIKMHGDTSLILRKKNLGLKVHSVEGNGNLHYDLFGGGVTEFTNFVLRAGQDQNASIIKNELCENLAAKASDNVITTRSKYCVVYSNGKYLGIYALSEKTNEIHYANLLGVNKDSVEIVDYVVPQETDLYKDVFDFCYKNDMSDPANYEHFCSLMDIDSLIDWIFIEGYFANSDLTFGNLRFCRSYDQDTRWKFMLYDMDATFSDKTFNHKTFLKRQMVQCEQVNHMVDQLLKNEDFKDRYLSRAAYLLNNELSNEAVLAEIERLAAEIQPEVERDFSGIHKKVSSWDYAVNSLKEFITKNDWKLYNIKTITVYLKLSAEEVEKYFGTTE